MFENINDDCEKINLSFSDFEFFVVKKSKNL